MGGVIDENSSHNRGFLTLLSVNEESSDPVSQWKRVTPYLHRSETWYRPALKNGS
jgi:hypothetical protein